LDLNEIIELVTALFNSMPWLVVGFSILVLVGSAFIVGNNTGAAKRIRASLDNIRSGLTRSRDILNQLGEQQDITAARIHEARDGIQSALDIIQAIRMGNDISNGDPDS